MVVILLIVAPSPPLISPLLIRVGFGNASKKKQIQSLAFFFAPFFLCSLYMSIAIVGIGVGVVGGVGRGFIF